MRAFGALAPVVPGQRVFQEAQYDDARTLAIGQGSLRAAIEIRLSSNLGNASKTSNASEVFKVPRTALVTNP